MGTSQDLCLRHWAHKGTLLTKGLDRETRLDTPQALLAAVGEAPEQKLWPQTPKVQQGHRPQAGRPVLSSSP
jgi:hypothetical protein